MYLYHPGASVDWHMAYDSRWQMNCCIACGGPFTPTRKAVRARKIGAQSLDYMENQVLRNFNEWDVAKGSEVNLVAKANDLHMVHDKNSIPCIAQFLRGGRLGKIWRDDALAGYQEARRNRIRVNAQMKNKWLYARAPDGHKGNSYFAVFWDAPEEIDFLELLQDCIKNCIIRSNRRVGGVLKAKVLPNINTTYPGCKDCNDIMTQESTMRHFLAREVATYVPIVPEKIMYVYDLKGNPVTPGQTQIRSERRKEPRLDARRNSAFSFQAALMYYLHRCLPNEPPAGSLVQEGLFRIFHIFFAYFLLEICCLMFERIYGKYGGTAKRTKPAYRYKGVTELYISHIIWFLLSNDVAEGQAVDGTGSGMVMDFPIFHRYFFSGIMRSLVLMHPKAAKAVEISDVIFGSIIFDNALNVIVPTVGDVMSNPDDVIGFMGRRIARFYRQIIRPNFSIHLAGLTPPEPPVGAGDSAKRTFADRVLVSNMLIERNDMTILLRMCERAAADDVDSYMNNVGIHAVMEVWGENLKAAPVRVENMLMDWVDKWTLVEYHNIVRFNRQDPLQPRISPQVAESIFQMCFAVEWPVVPVNQEELDILRQAPKCTAAKAALRLEYAGAFRDDGEGVEDSGSGSDDD